MSEEINFLHPKFKTKVTSSCIAEDDYQPTNLVSQDFWSQDRGFMAYNVVKPPVTLTFNFPHPIEVIRVKLWPVSGSQRSTGFEIQVSTRQDFQAVAKCTRTTANIVEFNRVAETNAPTSSSCSQLKFFSSNFIMRSLSHVSSMRVIITATERCAAVLKRIEIWGVPSSKLDAAAREECKRLWQKTATPRPCRDNEVASSSTSQPSKPLLDIEHIPEEYLDSITYELMLFPMRLPCGKAVDQSTIEKNSRIEEKWGRAASDPFTGKLFSANSKPVLDATLKSRIDRFLLQNANRQDVKRLPRTLGRKSNGGEGVVKRERSCTSYIVPVKRPKSEDVGELQSLQFSVIPIDEAMQSALRAIRKRSTVLSATDGAQRSVCISCQSNNCLYKIKTCDHLICRNCLNKIRSSLVCTCSKSFLSSDVERIFQ